MQASTGNTVKEEKMKSHWRRLTREERKAKRICEKQRWSQEFQKRSEPKMWTKPRKKVRGKGRSEIPANLLRRSGRCTT